MSSEKSIPFTTSSASPGGAFIAPTPQNTPLNPAPITSGLSRPTVPDIPEADGSDDDDAPAGATSDSAKAAIQATMLNMVQGKLAGLLGKSSGYVENLPFVVKRRVEGLKGVQAQYNQLEAEFKKELAELEKKYLKRYNPIFDRRHEILIGTKEVSDEEVKAGEEQTLKDDPDDEPLTAQGDQDKEAGKDTKGIPEFWLTALRNHVEISELITERDEDALKSLTDIRVAYLEDGTYGFTLSFYFSPNDYFTNEILTKTYHYQDELGYGGDYVYDKAEGCKIDWKEDKDLTKHVEVTKQRNKKTNRTRLIRKTHRTPSFFDFFSPPSPPKEEDIESGDIEEDELDDLEEKLEMDHQLGEDIKERIIPRAIDYFTGKALAYELTDDDDDDDGDDDDDDEEDPELSDDDDEEEIEIPTKRRPATKSAAQAKAGPGEPECKQQ